ncbi:gp002 [Rhodococcus phage ReqiDocB7]|uniref:terminase small subunit n=1 Tax=Rhodococcus phage ReqiDocB7 TaxID=691966 RepID=UPI0001CDEA8B|nr:terminase small subunit [Rhodococcus phage ReqiDocB7]ADD80788.1 gp002 [Rhodococcus phage ReqiDocB7]
MCTVPGSEGKKLADYFKSTNPAEIAEGMRSIVAEQADIVDEMLADHKARGTDETDPELMKNMNSVFKNAKSLHDIVNPKQKGPLVQIGIANGMPLPAINSSSDPRELAAMVVKELEAQLPPGTEITDEMVKMRLEQYVGAQKAIEAEVIEP